MHAIVLVGGFGTRLRPLTDTIPKSMLTVGNEPIITRLVRRLERSGVTTVTLSLGFLPDVFIAAFPGGRCGDVQMRYAVEPEPLDTAGAIRFSAEFAGIDDTFVVVNGDVVTDLDVAALVRSHRARHAEATLHLYAVEDPSAFGVVELDHASRVTRFFEKPLPGTTDSNLINAGTYVLESSVLDDIAPGIPVSVERDTFPKVAARGGLCGVATQDYWLDIGRPDLYLKANLDLLAGRCDVGLPSLVAGGRGVDEQATLADGATAIDSVIAAGVTVGARSRIQRSVLLSGASVGQDVVVEDSVVMGAIGDGAKLTDAVVGASAMIGPGQQVASERIPASPI